MRRFLGALIAVQLVVVSVAVSGTAPVNAQSAVPPGPGDVGPGAPTNAVGRRTIQIPSEPGRTLTADVWYPADAAAVAGVAKSTYTFPGLSYTSSVAFDAPPVSGAGPFPLVVYSHGSGGLRYISAYLAESLAGRGFVVVAGDHTGNTAFDDFAKTTLPRKEIVRLRPVDIRAEIDAMAAASADPASPFTGAIDTTRVGLVGHSAGGTGVLMTTAGHDGVAADKRVRGVVGLAAYVDPVSERELARLTIPVMLISGTLDATPPTGSIYVGPATSPSATSATTRSSSPRRQVSRRRSSRPSSRARMRRAHPGSSRSPRHTRSSTATPSGSSSATSRATSLRRDG